MATAVIFDCFGVLVGKGFDHTYRLAGGDPAADRHFVESLLGQANLGMITDAEFHNAMATHLGVTASQWQAVLAESEQPDAVLLEYIHSLREKGMQTAVLSNANTGTLSEVLGDTVLAAHFDAVIVSAEVGYAKPDTRIYEHVVRQLNVPASECIFIDDRHSFLPPAEALGMATILARDTDQIIADIEQLLA